MIMTAWWTNDKIKATVTQNYIEKELGSRKHQDALHRVLAFGDGLTDDTYLDWILERSPRFFLVLNDIGVPDRIFGIIDRSFDDDDLPLSQDALWELNLFGTSSETLDKKFFRQQFNFLVQELEPGGHVDFSTWEVVPLLPVGRKGSIGPAHQFSDKVTVHDDLYTRKKLPDSGDNGIDRIKFIMHLKHLAAVQHRHLVTVWATYSQDNFNYVLLTPCADTTLKQFFEEQPKHFKNLEKHERRQILLTWTQCITSAVAYLHSKGFFHRAIRPSTITIDHNNVVHLTDYNAVKALDVEESPNPYSGELYEYAPPENWQRQPRMHETAPLKTYLPGGGRTTRRLPKAMITGPDIRPPPSPNCNMSISRTDSKSHSSSGSSTNARPRNALITTFAPPDMSLILPNSHFPADIFSLTAVLLTLTSFLLGHTPKSFASHRSRLNRQAGRGNAPPDASFHKNLKQVDKWIDMLAKEAGQKENKDLKLWGAISEVVNICSLGIAKEPHARIPASELEDKISGWVDWGLGRRRKCKCTEETRQSAEEQKLHPVQAAQRDSILSWSKISERISEGLEGEMYMPTPVTLRPRRSLSQRKSYDRSSHLQRPRSSRTMSAITSRISSAFGDRDREPPSPFSLGRQSSFGGSEMGLSRQQQRWTDTITESLYENAPSIVGQAVPEREGDLERISHDGPSEVWGLGTALEDDGSITPRHENGTVDQKTIAKGEVDKFMREEIFTKGMQKGAAMERQRLKSYAAMEKGMGRESCSERAPEKGKMRESYAANTSRKSGRGKEERERMDWPLPLGTLTFDRGVV